MSWNFLSRSSKPKSKDKNNEEDHKRRSKDNSAGSLDIFVQSDDAEKSIARAEGIGNFGNTCFVNGMLQLMQVPSLMLLKDLGRAKSEEFSALQSFYCKQMDAHTLINEYLVSISPYLYEKRVAHGQGDSMIVLSEILTHLSEIDSSYFESFCLRGARQVSSCAECSRKLRATITQEISTFDRSDRNIRDVQSHLDELIQIGLDSCPNSKCAVALSPATKWTWPRFLLIRMGTSDVSKNLELNRYIIAPCSGQEEGQPTCYELSAVTLHSNYDFNDFGHIVAAAKRGDQWYLFDDNRTSEIYPYRNSDLVADIRRCTRFSSAVLLLYVRLDKQQSLERAQWLQSQYEKRSKKSTTSIKTEANSREEPSDKATMSKQSNKADKEGKRHSEGQLAAAARSAVEHPSDIKGSYSNFQHVAQSSSQTSYPPVTYQFPPSTEVVAPAPPQPEPASQSYQYDIASQLVGFLRQQNAALTKEKEEAQAAVAALQQQLAAVLAASATKDAALHEKDQEIANWRNSYATAIEEFNKICAQLKAANAEAATRQDVMDESG